MIGGPLLVKFIQTNDFLIFHVRFGWVAPATDRLPADTWKPSALFNNRRQ